MRDEINLEIDQNTPTRSSGQAARSSSCTTLASSFPALSHGLRTERVPARPRSTGWRTGNTAPELSGHAMTTSWTVLLFTHREGYRFINRKRYPHAELYRISRGKLRLRLRTGRIIRIPPTVAGLPIRTPRCITRPSGASMALLGSGLG